MLQWMFFEQYTHEPSIAVARFIRRFLKRDDDPRLPGLHTAGERALAVMEEHLAREPYFVAGRLSTSFMERFMTEKKAPATGKLAESA